MTTSPSISPSLTPDLQRRTLLHLLAGTALVGVAPGLALARAATQRRFVFIIQRGAADGLDTLVPVADPGYARLRGAIAVDAGAAHALDGSFALHPALAGLAGLYAAREAVFLHAVASPYRERSHFDGQNVLESGGTSAYQVKDGWLNRLVGLLPRASGTGQPAIAIAPTVPLALRGAAEVASYAPSGLPSASDDLMLRVARLYEGDAQLHGLWTAAMDARGIAQGGAMQTPARQDAAGLGALAASFLAQPDGPRIAMLETGGWDTHSAQSSRLAAQLRNLDTLVLALRDNLGDAWRQTVVLVATEFGRTAAANGTGGTDHGTGAAALLLGGAVQGGRVLADWPGLAPGQLYEGRDLRPTLGLDALIARAAAECFALEPAQVARVLFPHGGAAQWGSGPAAALPTLLRG